MKCHYQKLKPAVAQVLGFLLYDKTANSREERDDCAEDGAGSEWPLPQAKVAHATEQGN